MKCKRDGYVLMAALWLVVAISAVALQAGTQTRMKRLALRNATDLELARNNAWSGLALARAELTGLMRSDAPLDPLASVHQRSVADTASTWRFTLHYEDAESRVNINTSDADQLERLFTGLALDKARQAAEAIITARTAAGPFRELGDIAKLDGIGAAGYPLVEPYVTVIGTGRINLNTAPSVVLSSLPGISARAVALIEHERLAPNRIMSVFQIVNGLGEPDGSTLSAVLPALQYATTVETRYVSVTSVAANPHSVMRAEVHADFVREGTSVRLLGVQWH